MRSFGPVSQLRMARTLFGRPLFWVAAYHVDGLLIDTGCAYTAGEMTQALGGQEMAQVVNTHHHEDHIGGNAAVFARWGLSPGIHPLGLKPLLAARTELPFYRRVTWGMPPGSAPHPLGDSVVTDRYLFRVVHAPGHSPDQVVLFEEREGWLFSADLYLARRVRQLRRDEDLPTSLQSLRAVAGLPIGRLFCSGGAVMDGGAAALRAKLDYWEGLVRSVAELSEAGRTRVQIRQELLGAEGVMYWVSCGEFAKQHLVDKALGMRADDRRSESPQR